MTRIWNLGAKEAAKRTHLVQFWSVSRSPLVLETVIASDNSCITRIGDHQVPEEHLLCGLHHTLCAYNASSLNLGVHVAGVLCEH